jgi:2-polyprenyl-3-methyl-5-hydroxy-6-metoxy-1,4-benzoquinol methylase
MFHVEQNKEYSECRVCKSTSLSLYLQVKDHFLSKENFQLLKCDECHTLMTTPVPASNEIARYYQSEAYVSHSDTQKGLVNFAYQQVKKITLNQKMSLVRNCMPDQKSLLDFGCGTGDFANHCRINGIDTTGIEPDPDARKRAADKGVNVGDLDMLKTIKKTFGVISLWHVLEHTYDPVKTILDLKKLLVPRGTIIIAVPNYLSHDAQRYREFWAAYDVPRHLFHFSQKSIAKLAEQTGLTLEKVLPMKFDAFYVSIISERYKNGNIVNGSAQGLKSNLSATKTGEYSSLIYILRN